MTLLRLTARLLAPCALAGALCAPAALHAQAGTRVAVAIPATTLDEALRLLARQAGIAVGGTERGMSAVRTRSIRGRMTPAEALRRLLEGTGYRAVPVAEGTWRIEQAPALAPARTPRPAPSPPPIPPEPILVTASKRGLTLADYPGGVQLADLGARGFETAAGLEDVLDRFPQTSGTHLGPGRNKIFVRGIADSSFNGPTQATIGLYLGEQRLIYSAPNPELPAWDLERVELLEGPQGTLYGAGALGGVIRMVPKSPDPTRTAGEAWGGATLTEHGEPGFVVGAMANAPLAEHAALRLVGYGSREGGYIADPTRGLDDINRSGTYGGRGALRVGSADGWAVTASGFIQRRRVDDGQYIDSTLPGLARASVIAQPFASDIAGAGLTITGRLGALDVVSTSGIVGDQLDTRFDSSRLVGPGASQFYEERRDIELLNHETRIASPQGGAFAWLLGISLLRNRDDFVQRVVSSGGGNPPPFATIDYTIREYALFGEGTVRLAPDVRLTLGGRAIHSRAESVRYFGVNVAADADTPKLRFLPMAALAWRPAGDWLVYARYQRSYRPGGVTIERALDGTPNPTKFRPDSLQSAEIGARADLQGTVSGPVSLAAFYTRWTDIQGDLVQEQGFPITRNLGDGWIAGLTASAQLRLPSGWHADAAIFANRSRIARLTPTQAINSRELPSVPAFTGRAGVGVDLPVQGDRLLTLAARAGYTGTSYLDITPTDQVPQGDYWDSELSASLRGHHWSVTLAARNPLDVRGNRFALGNPFDVRFQSQATPLRPRSVQVLAHVDF